MMVQFQYENPDTGLEMGIFYQGRSSTTAGNDSPQKTAGTPADDYIVGGTGATKSKVSTRNVSLYSLKDTKTMRFGVEASWQEGNYGIATSSGKEVEFTGYGIALELEYRPQASKFKFGIKSGYASGDDPSTDDKYEGFIFDRNYDVAFLMFNHPLGQKNLLRTQNIGTEDTSSSTFTHQTPDVEAISNAIYFSPYINYAWSDRWSLDTRLTTGILQVDPIANGNVDKSLGYELDLSFNYKPNNRVTWINELGLVFPGSAFKAGDVNNFETGTSYGLMTKAAISF